MVTWHLGQAMQGNIRGEFVPLPHGGNDTTADNPRT